MKTKVLFLSLILAITHLILFGQSEDYINNVIPPSPNAASLGKYVEAPVSLATGIPNIGIPIYTISEGPISVPISLSYHAGGIKVEEVASWVGLGWTLNAGGVITRITQGLPDDCSQGYINTTYTVEVLRGIAHDARYNQFVEMSVGNRDYEPDIFMFNFSGYSGRFFYDQTTDKFIQAPYSNIEIEENYGTSDRIESWVFTTPDGFKYYFGKSQDGTRSGVEENPGLISYSRQENSMAFNNASNNIPDHTSSWYLMDIIAPTGHQVNFNYRSIIGGVRQLNKTQESFIWPKCDASAFSASFSDVFTDLVYVSSIEFSNGKVEFIHDNVGRVDLTGDYALKKINIFEKNSLWKSFNLYHDYFYSSPEISKWTSLGDANQRRYRLKLLAVEEQTSTGEKKPPYILEYNPIQLPSRFSNAQDYWGYYNGKISNTSLLPETRTTTGLYIGDVDRTVDAELSQASILKKIIYPTGGSAEYYYESNTAKISNVISEVSTDYNLRNRLDESTVPFYKDPLNLDPDVQYDYSKEITIGIGRVGPVNFVTTVTGCTSSDPSQPQGLGCDYLLKVVGVSDPLFPEEIIESNGSSDFELPAGTYKVVAINNSESTDGDFSVTIKWGEDPHPEYLNIGGLRVKKTIITDGFGNTIEKNYNYNLFGSNLTSGYTISSPIFLDEQYYNSTCEPGHNVLKLTSYSQAPLSSVKGSVLGYGNVTEYRTDGAKTEYAFNVSGDREHYNSVTFGNVHLPDLYSDWIRGNLIRQEKFEFKNDLYSSVEKVENEYETVQTYFLQDFGVHVVNTIGSLAVNTLKYGFYSGVSEWHRLKSTTTTNYFGANEVVVKQEFIYDNNQLLASAVKSFKSAGDTLINKTYYAPEMGLTALVNEHRIAEPIKQEVYKKVGVNAPSLLSTQLTIYDTTYSGGLTLPHYIQTSKGGNALENRVEFHDYDNYGNIKEVSKLDDKHTIYIWGYNKTKPIAKITGATFSEVQPHEASLQALSDIDTDAVSEGVFRNSLDNFRSSLSNAKIETYTYNPLVGMTSATNERGQTTFYEYDGFGRLSLIRNHEGEIVKKYDYNYQTATANFLYVADPVFEPVAGNYEDSLYVKINGLTPGSKVYFAFGDTIPDETSYLYGDSIYIPGGMDTIINAIALLDGYNPSNLVTATYSVSCKVDSILFDSISGTYADSLKVGISCLTPDVSIYYTLDGSEPDSTSTLYAEPVFMPIGFITTIKAKAYSDICISSEIDSAVYTVTCETAAPDFSHTSGTYLASIDVNLIPGTENDTIYYTLDGSEPNNTKTLYNGTPITLLEGTTTTIKAIAYSDLCNQSTVVSATYTIECSASEPTFSIGSGDYDWPQSVELGALAGEIIYYAFGDTVPNDSCRQYSSAIPLDPGTSTLNARAFKNGCNPGTHVSRTYNVTQLKVATPVINPNSQSFTNSISVSITCDTIGATIYYTDDNTDPKTSASKKEYSGDFTITSTKMIRAYAKKINYIDSDEATPRTYTIQVAQPDISPSSRDFTGSMDVTFYCSTPGATIYYSSNGLPTRSSPSIPSGGIITITETTTFNAFAVKTGYADSEYATPRTYTEVPLCTLSVNPGSGAVNPCGGLSDVATVTATGATPGVTSWPSWVINASIVGTTLRVDCEPNDEGAYRDGIITITAGACTETFTVQQNPLTLDAPDKTIIACAQEGVSVQITSNVCSFGAPQESLDWISNASIVSGNLVFDCTENETGSSRSGTITISGNGISKDITVTQQANTDEFDIINTSGAIDPVGGPTNTFVATVSSNLNWHPYVPTEKIDGWLQATPVGNTIVFEADKNDYDFRDVTLKISVPGTCHNLLDSITISQDHTPCNVSVDPPFNTGLSFPAGGGTQSITISTNKTQVYFDCPSWITVTENSPFYDVTCKADTTLGDRFFRIGITVEGGTCTTFLDVDQEGATPYLTLDPTFKNANPDGENFVVTVSTNLPDYNVVESADWIGFTKATSRFVIEPNDSGSFRFYDVEFKDLSGTVMQTFLISQDPNCSFSIITEESNISAAGISQANAFDVLVSTTEATYDVSVPSWLHYSGPNQDNLILVWCDENYEVTPRQSVIRVQALGAEGSICYAEELITQAGADPELNLSQSSISENSDAGTYSITASNNFSNNFAVSIPPADQSWISYTTAGTLVSFTLTENTTSSDRTANITIAGEGLTRTLTITQERFIGRVSLSPLAAIVSAVNDQVTIQVSSNASWTVSKDVDWLSISTVSGSGDGSVIVTCTADPNDGIPGIPQSGQITFTPSSGGVARSVTIDFVASQQPD